MTQATPDAKAIAAAKHLREAIDADCVILFGSRARTDWTDASDLDLVILSQAMPEQKAMLGAQDRAASIASETFGRPLTVDVLFMTHRDFALMSSRTINHVAARARRQGLFMPRNTEEYGFRHDEDYEENDQLEYQERERRIADTNVHYRNMQGLLDLGFEDKDTAFLAQQTIENAMKALISALGEEYNTHHSPRALARDIQGLDPGRDWQFSSNLEQLDNFAGGTLYGPTLTPVSDYREMANNVTEDLDRIYERITQLTGTNPWDIPPEGASSPVAPRWRPEPLD